MNVVMYGPGNYTDGVGGILACHKLMHNLALLGHNSYVVCEHINPEYKAKALTLPEIPKLTQRDDTIVIYPEIVNGNPLNGKKVMRWILNIPGLIGGNEDTYGKNDLYFQFSKGFPVNYPERVKGMLIAVEQHLDIFKDLNLPRKGTCLTVRKGHYKPLDKHPKDYIDIDSVGVNNFKGLNDLFNRTHVFISYDHATYTSVSAALCGCLSIVIPDDNITVEQWRDYSPFNKYGVSYGLSDIAHAMETQHLLRSELERIEEESIEQARTMIKLFQ